MIDTTYDLTLLEMAKSGDEKSREEFIDKNKGLVHLVVKRFLNRGTETEDLIQLGMIGLVKAMTNFDFNYDVKFSTYAVPVISGEIRRFLRDDGIIKVSRGIKELSKKIREKSEEYERIHFCEPTVSELSKMLLVSEEDIVLALGAGDNIYSLDETCNKEDDILLMDKIEDKKAESEDEIVDKLTLKEMLSHLKPRERQVIMLRYFKEMTQESISKLMGVSQVQVCRIEKKVLKILKDKLKE